MGSDKTRQAQAHDHGQQAVYRSSHGSTVAARFGRAHWMQFAQFSKGMAGSVTLHYHDYLPA
jgi:hypothetical protein